MKQNILSLIVLTSCAYVANAQDFHKRVMATYNFSPTKLSDQERQQKSDMLDSLWKYVESDTAKHLPELRKELQTNSDSGFFYFDGSSLLLTLTHNPGDLKIAFYAVGRCSIADLQGGPYVEMLHLFAANGYNTTDEALKIIDAKGFSAYFPQHVMTLNKNLSLMFALLALDDKLYLDKVFAKLGQLQDTDDIKQVLDFLSFVCNCRADSAIRAYTNDPKQIAAIRRYAKEDLLPDSIKAVDNSGKFQNLADERKKNLVTRGVSDEALDDIDQETAEMKRNYICR